MCTSQDQDMNLCKTCHTRLLTTSQINSWSQTGRNQISIPLEALRSLVIQRLVLRASRYPKNLTDMPLMSSSCRHVLARNDSLFLSEAATPHDPGFDNLICMWGIAWPVELVRQPASPICPRCVQRASSEWARGQRQADSDRFPRFPSICSNQASPNTESQVAITRKLTLCGVKVASFFILITSLQTLRYVHVSTIPLCH
jgi:hypothetical protein